MTLFPDEPQRLSLVRLGSLIAKSAAAIGRVTVEGEVHRPTHTGGGSVYFTLRDRAAQMSVVCPRGKAARCRAVNGERVAVTGRVEWVPMRGQVQLVADEVVPVGTGAIAAMMQEARARLAADGLLTRRRRSIPLLPRGIAVVCGTEAAVRRDIESVVVARFPGYPVRFHEVPVSGPGAAEAVIGAIRHLDSDPTVDVIVLARGGGDATHLLPFSDEQLCRAVCASSTPVVSAIGHEGDRPLCDDVADLRCGTPSLAATAVIPDREALLAHLDALRERAIAGVRRSAERAAGRLALVDTRSAVVRSLERSQARVDAVAGRLDALSPARVLERGYAVVRLAPGGDVVRDPASVPPGARLDLQVAGGHIAAVSEGAA